MALDFPINPTIGDEYSAGGFTWTWSGSSWDKIASAAVGIPSGETADRPATPAIGDQFYNGTLGVLELYTSSGWLPATGANDFNVVLTGATTSVTLDKEYFAGAYTIASSLLDTTFDIYLFDTSNNPAGYSKSPSINATGNFNKIIVYGGTEGDLLSFSYKTTFTTSISSTDTFAAPYITSISVADLPNIDDTTTITGGNFDTDIEVWFDGANDYSQQAKSVVYGSSTSVVVTRPDDLLEDNAPYTLRVINPGTTSPTGSNSNKLINSVTAGGDPVWTTPSGVLGSAVMPNNSYAETLVATDPDGGPITYSIVSGALPNGVSLNSNTGEVSGTPTSAVESSFVVSATDNGGNITNRSFTIAVFEATGGTVTDINVDGVDYRLHSFTDVGAHTFTTSAIAKDLPVDVLIVAGGGGSGWDLSGGGGGGGVVYLEQEVDIPAGSYSIYVGDGGDGSSTYYGRAEINGENGENSEAFGYVAVGGGGSGFQNGNSQGNSGGSGGGSAGTATSSGGASSQPTSVTGLFASSAVGYGSAGGASGGAAPNYPAGGGGGAGQAGQSPSGASSAGGKGGDGIQINIDGNNYYWGGGGGGASHTDSAGGGNGGLGGGGGGAGTAGSSSGGSGGGQAINSGGNGYVAADGSSVFPPPQVGGTNTGGGAGGAHNNNPSGNGAKGGSGIVMVRYPI